MAGKVVARFSRDVFVGDLGGPLLDRLGGLPHTLLPSLFETAVMSLAANGFDVRFGFCEHLADLFADRSR